MFYQSGGVMNRYRIFSINPTPQFRSQAFSRFSYFLGEKLWRRDCSPPPARPGVYYKRCLVSLNLQYARARFLLRRVDSFFLVGVNLSLMTYDYNNANERLRPGREDTPRNSWRVCAVRFSDLDPLLFQAKTCHFSHLEWLDLRFKIHTLFTPGLEKLFPICKPLPRPSQVFFEHCFY